MYQKLSKILQTASFADYPRKSRVHPLNTFGSSDCRCFVKRDDELGFGISGSKVRKYLSLLPSFLAKGMKEAVLIGSPFSNHVLSLSQLLKENGIRPILFLVGEKPKKRIGNFLLTSLMVEEENMHFFPKSSWGNIEKLAEEFALKREKAAVIPMGASCEEAFLGCLTLAEDILRNEKEQCLTFDHIFVDAGTGMMAACLILSLGFLGRKTRVHVVQVADGEKEFKETLQRWQKEFEKVSQISLQIPVFDRYLPSHAKSFGSVNQEILNTIEEIARNEGFFTDPVYTAKLFQRGKEIVNGLQGNVLFVHSGGALSLMGFQEWW